jgi:hypothetical protein
MTSIQYAWMFYAAGSLGCCIAGWWFFLWAWRFVRYSVVATIAVILFTPYAIDSQTMLMAPAVYTLLFEGMASGIDSVKPVVKLMVAIWLIAIILVAVYVILTRRSALQEEEAPQENFVGYTKRNSRHFRTADEKNSEASFESNSEPPMASVYSQDKNDKERQAAKEMLKGEIPIRAIRD